MLVRDAQQIIIQHSTESWLKDYADGGDSCARTGIEALRSDLDRSLLPLFIVDGKVVRHPYQPGHNDPNNTSRDNVVQYACSLRNSPIMVQYAESWTINKDALSPAIKYYFYKSSTKKPQRWLEELANLNLWGDIFWNSYVAPEEEINQFSCVVLKSGPKWVRRLYRFHPNLEGVIRQYWNGWRNQPEIGETLITELRRVRDEK